ncbi:MAG: prolyl oligopeptidase family serine peptidase [Bdellovibrionota bacterium]
MKRLPLILFFIFIGIPLLAHSGDSPISAGGKCSEYLLSPRDRQDVEPIYRLGYGQEMRRRLTEATRRTEERLGPIYRKEIYEDLKNLFTEPPAPKSPQNGYEYNGVHYELIEGNALPKLSMRHIATGATKSVELSSVEPIVNRPDQYTYQILSVDGTLSNLIYAVYEKNGSSDVNIYALDLNTGKSLPIYRCSYCLYNLRYLGHKVGAWLGNNNEFWISGDYSRTKNVTLVKAKFNSSTEVTIEESPIVKEVSLYGDNTSFSNLDGGILTPDSRFLTLESPSREYRYNKIIFTETGTELYSGYEGIPAGTKVDFAVYVSEGKFLRILSRDRKHFSIEELTCNSTGCKRRQIASGPEIQFLNEFTLESFSYNLKATHEKIYALLYRELQPELVIFDLSSKRTSRVFLPEIKSDAGFTTVDPASPTLAFNGKNALMENLQVTLDHKTLEILEVKNLESRPFKDYAMEVMYSKSQDGTAVPITVLKPKGVVVTPSTPLMAYVYSEYATPGIPSWMGREHVEPLLRRGHVIAFAHARGSGDFGTPWYEAGSHKNKARGVEDFESVLRKLHESGISSPDFTAIKGFSAGGTMISVTLAKTPELFKVAFLEWPITDALNFVRETKSFLAGPESLRPIGNPDESLEMKKIIFKRSGLHLLQPPKRKNIVWLTTSADDLQVPPSFPLGYETKATRLGYEAHLYSSSSGGHLGYETPENGWRALAFEYSLLEHAFKKESE